MPKQPVIPGLRDAMKKKVTRREQFLAEMDYAALWYAGGCYDHRCVVLPPFDRTLRRLRFELR